MRKLQNQPNAIPPSSDYPYGRLKDDPGDGTGVPVNEEVYGDIHQFFMRLADVGDVPINNLPDNAYSGFQLFQALLNLIKYQIDNQVLATLTVPIGDWDMDANSGKIVSHPLTNNLKIRKVDIMVINDAGTAVYPAGTGEAAGGGNLELGYTVINTVDIRLVRRTGGFFDGVNFDATSYNRGFVTFTYER